MPITEAEARAALPPDGWLRRYVRHAALQTTAPLGYHIGVGLTLLGVTCPLAYGLHYAGTLRANNFVLLVGRSGEDNKSSALGVGREILDAAAAPLIGDFPGSPEGLIESLSNVPSQLIPISEFGKFLSSAQRGYFEPTKTLLADVWDCVDESTQILTAAGWKSIGQIEKGSMVYALDTETDKLVLTPALDVGERAVRDGEMMVALKGHNHDIRVTEGHRIYLKYRLNSKPSPAYQVKTGREMPGRRSSFYLPFSAEPSWVQSSCPLTDDELRFVAWTMTDCGQDRSALVLSQSNKKYLSHLRDLLDRLNLAYTEYTAKPNAGTYKTTGTVHNFRVPKADQPDGRRGWNHYEEYLKDSISDSLFAMSNEQFRLFWHELLLGDGEQVGEGMKGLLWSVNKNFIDRLQHMAVDRGYSTQYGTRDLPSGKTAYRLSITEKRLVCTDPANERSIKFEFETPHVTERVWCVTNACNTIVTRRNGKVVILGNCLPVQRARANNKVIRVDNPRLSIAAACSIPYLEKHTLAEDWTGGFMGRWLVVYARRERIDADPIGDRTDFQWLVDELQKRASTPTAGWCIGLDSAARRYWNDWYDDIMNRNLPNNIIGIRARAPTLCRKMVLMYGWDFGPAGFAQPWQADIPILEPAIAFTELHIKSLVHLSEVIAEHNDARLRRSVLQAIDQFGGVATLGEILSVLKMRKRVVVEHLEALIEEGRVGKLPTPLGHQTFEHRKTL